MLYDPPNSLDASLEWVEFFNSGCDAVDLSTYTLQDNQGILNLSGTIQPNSYLIFANKCLIKLDLNYKKKQYWIIEIQLIKKKQSKNQGLWKS